MRYFTSILTITSALMLGHQAVTAQQMDFSGSALESGDNLQVGSSYRFSNVRSGIDARITLDGISNATLVDIDGKNAQSIDDANWRPVFAGNDDGDLHFADFTVEFLNSGGDQAVSMGSLQNLVFGNDLSQNTSGFVMEFAHSTGYASLVEEQHAPGQTHHYLSGWKYEDKSSISLRIGWQGANAPGSVRSFTNVLSSNSTVTSPSSPNNNLTLVPEPSSSLLTMLGISFICLRRKRIALASD